MRTPHEYDDGADGIANLIEIFFSTFACRRSQSGNEYYKYSTKYSHSPTKIKVEKK